VISPVTDLAKWKASHSRPVVIDYCRWNQALESIVRANIDAYITLTFVWPRVLLRTSFGI
jgi:hypothetical protein